MKLLGKLRCWWSGKHARGKRLANAGDTDERMYACPRCGATWTKKARKGRAA